MSPRVVIAHDFMEAYGGAERVTAVMAAAFPEAPVYAFTGRRAVARRMGVESRFRPLIPGRPLVLRRYRALLPLWAALAETARLPAADVLLTSSYALAHRLRTVDDAPQVCFCHTPMRFAWTVTDAYRDALAGSSLTARALDAAAALARASDRRSSRGVDVYLTQSEYTADQIRTFYGRDAEVIGAPVDGTTFRPAANGAGPGEEARDAYLICSRLYEASKTVAYAIEAFRSLPGERLVVAGAGPALDRLRQAAPPNVRFVGNLGDVALVEAMRRCKAVIFPSRDAFGLIPVEAMCCGRPVIALAEGGALQTVVEGVTGTFFAEQTSEAVAGAVRGFRPEAFDPTTIRDHALQWDIGTWIARLRDAVDQAAATRR